MNYLAATVTKLTFCRSALVTDTQPILRPAACLLWHSFRHATVTAATSKMRFHCLREVKCMMAFVERLPRIQAIRLLLVMANISVSILAITQTAEVILLDVCGVWTRVFFLQEINPSRLFCYESDWRDLHCFPRRS